MPGCWVGETIRYRGSRSELSISMSNVLDAESHLNSLVELSKIDLSQAHILQHNHTADLTVKIANLTVQGTGAHSSQKPMDTVKIANNTLQGQKFWVSDLPNVSWGVIIVDQQVVYFDLDNSVQTHMVSTMGMENTLTGHLSFNDTPCRIICHMDDADYFFVRRAHSYAFIANLYGLSQALFADIDKFTNQTNIDCNYNKQKIKLQLDVLGLLWQQLPKQITLKQQGHFYWHQKNIVYAFAKKCLTETCQLVTEMTGSGLYDFTTNNNQRYRDALIYSTHMQNLYRAMQS